MLSQFLYLPTSLQQQLIQAMGAYEHVRQANESHHTGQREPVSLSDLLTILEGLLPVC